MYLVVALSTWRQILFRAQGRLAVKGDALNVLQDVIKLKARDPILNDITGENALVLAPQGGDIRAAHVWPEKNETCDMLSRLKPGAKIPLRGLEDATQCTPRRVRGSLQGELL